MRRIRTRAAVVLFVVASSAACTGDARHARRHAGEPPPRRVLSLIPSITETIVAMGAPDRLVGRTDYDTSPALADLPSVGGTQDPSLERLVSLAPDVVIVWATLGSPDLVPRLRAAGIAVHPMRAETLADLWVNIMALGRLLGIPSSADSLRAALQDSLAAVRAAVAGRRRVDVCYLVWHDPPITTGPGTFIDEMITIAGGRNVFRDAATDWPTVSIESIVLRDPDILIVSGHETSLGRRGFNLPRPWHEVPAVRQGRIVRVDGDLFNRPGPRLATAARTLATALHPAGSSDGLRPMLGQATRERVTDRRSLQRLHSRATASAVRDATIIRGSADLQSADPDVAPSTKLPSGATGDRP